MAAGGAGSDPTVVAGASMPSADAAADVLPWVEKYRPNSLDDLIAHEQIISTINRLIDANRLPHLLFYGPPGTGKTSTILACAKRLYGEKYKTMTLELNASDDRGIGVVRDQIKSFAGTKKLWSAGMKLIILDEADAMTNDAQFALRRVIEKYSKNARFCLICNYVSKIIPALQSRCTRFRFAPLRRAQLEGRVREIAAAESVTLPAGGLKALLRLSQGDMRRALNILQSVSLAFDEVTEDNVFATTGDPTPGEIKAVVAALMQQSFAEVNTLLRTMQRDRGFALGDIVVGVSRTVVVMKLPWRVKSLLVRRMADIQHRLSFGVSETVQIASLVGGFVEARDLLTKQAQQGQ